MSSCRCKTIANRFSAHAVLSVSDLSANLLFLEDHVTLPESLVGAINHLPPSPHWVVGYFESSPLPHWNHLTCTGRI